MNGAELLQALQAMEGAQDRRHGERWGPRTLDLDLLVLGRSVTDTAGLEIPHPRISERNFVLLPLAEIAPYLLVPGQGSVVRMVAAVAGKGPRIERLA
jgi:2-amino-4-hydroxy-6-hydroxymethyldihydropteridine diphosphokinase